MTHMKRKINQNWTKTDTDARISRKGHYNSYYNYILYVQQVVCRHERYFLKKVKLVDIKK